MRCLSIYLFCLIVFPGFGVAAELSVDLHNHLFMKEGLTWIFQGDFSGPIRASSWEDRFSVQTNPETLAKSNIGILVNSLYANQFFTTSPRDSIREQIRLTTRFLKEHPEWILAKDPKTARNALKEGKRVLILSLEGASVFLESEEDFKEFIDEAGIRIVTFMHFTDDRYGGAAFMRGIRALASPLAFLEQLFMPKHDHNGVRTNERGLSVSGAELAQKLIARKVWIDLSHSSDKTQEGLVPLLAAAGQPHLYTHGSLRYFKPAERAVSDAQLRAVAETGGIIGLCPSEESLEDTTGTEKYCPPGCSKKQCSRSIYALAAHYDRAAAIIGSDAVMMGTDFNGGMDHLSPTCQTQTSLDEKGLWNVAQMPELWQSLRKVGAKVPPSLEATTEKFLEAWEKVWGR